MNSMNSFFMRGRILTQKSLNLDQMSSGFDKVAVEY